MTVRISQRRVDMNGVQLRLSKGADVASASALALGSDGNYFDVTGTTTITEIRAITTGTVIRLHFDSALTLTHHATNLILPGSANITTATGDNAKFTEYSPGAWRCTKYSRIDGTPVLGTIKQISKSTAYTLVLADEGKHIFHPSADTTARIWTIPANSSVAFSVGTAITFVNQNGAGVITIAVTTDTMRLAVDGTTGSRTLAANGVATALKVTETEWIISGSGLT